MKLGGPFSSHYGTNVEFIIHILYDCSFPLSIWTNVVKLHMISSFFTSSIKEWVNTNLRLNFGINGHQRGRNFRKPLAIHFGCEGIKHNLMNFF